MKCIKRADGKIDRVPNDIATMLVRSGSAAYSNKQSWKQQRDGAKVKVVVAPSKAAAPTKAVVKKGTVVKKPLRPRTRKGAGVSKKRKTS